MKTIHRDQSDSEKAASAKGRNSRIKGHNYEREIVNRLKALGFTAERGLQMRGGKRIADVTVFDKYGAVMYHIECKKGKQPNGKNALDQAIREKRPGAMPIAVCCKEPTEPFGFREETVTMKLGDWLELILMVHNG